MKRFLIILAIFTYSCSKPTIDRELSPDTKALREVKLENFLGEWFYSINKDQDFYQKIIVTKSGNDYKFEFYKNWATGWAIDEWTPTQIVNDKDFTSYWDSSFFIPYVTVKSNTTYGTSLIRYNIKNGIHSLEFDSSHFYKK